MSQRVLIACTPRDSLAEAQTALEAGGILVHFTDRSRAVIAASQEPQGPHVVVLKDKLKGESVQKLWSRLQEIEDRPKFIFVQETEEAPDGVEAVLAWPLDVHALVDAVQSLLNGKTVSRKEASLEDELFGDDDEHEPEEASALEQERERDLLEQEQLDEPTPTPTPAPASIDSDPDRNEASANEANGNEAQAEASADTGWAGESDWDMEPGFEADPIAQPEPESDEETKVEPEPESELEAQADPEAAGADAEPQPESEIEAQAEPEAVVADAERQPESELEAQDESEEAVGAHADSELEAEAGPGGDEPTRDEAVVRADQDDYNAARAEAELDSLEDVRTEQEDIARAWERELETENEREALAELVGRTRGSVLMYAGHLDTTPTPEILGLLIGSRETGTFLARRGDNTKSVTFINGDPVFATSNLATDQMSDPGSDDKVARVRDALRKQVLRIVYSLFDWSSGEFSFVSLIEVPPVDLKFPTPPPAILAEGVRRYWPAERVLPMLGGLHAVPAVLSSARPTAQRLRLTDGEARALDEIDGVRTVAQIMEEADCTQNEAATTLYTVMSLGCIALDIPEEDHEELPSKDEAIAEALALAGGGQSDAEPEAAGAGTEEEEEEEEGTPSEGGTQRSKPWRPPKATQKATRPAGGAIGLHSLQPVADDADDDDDRRAAPAQPPGVDKFEEIPAADLEPLDDDAPLDLEPEVSVEIEDNVDFATSDAAGKLEDKLKQRYEEVMSTEDPRERLGVSAEESASDLRSSYWIRRGEFKPEDHPSDDAKTMIKELQAAYRAAYESLTKK